MDDFLLNSYTISNVGSPDVGLSFKDRMLLRWDKIINELYEETLQTNLVSNQRNYWGNKFGMYNMIRGSIEKGMIPVPFTQDLVIENGKKVNPFTYSGLSKWYFLGIAPISIGHRTDIELSENIAHPFDARVTENTFSFAFHDVQHANIMSDEFFAQNLTDTSICEKFRKCFDPETLLAGFDSDEKKKISPYLRKSLFYLFHEQQAF